ncbi:SDR family NAD(P)-dependent oxidoreductase [Cupriavidus sp. 2TAF22]|uniref:SDR family NAD(P)-dependent oxidoreductase n=1 Tax=unclassified Cupriavidus TaxID=2640874 RepID=UPI003F92CFCA
MEPRRVALVTGASAGFGAAICRDLVRAGYHVIAAARRADRLAALGAELGSRLLPVAMDVCKIDEVESAAASLPEVFSEIDLLVNNAGLALGLELAPSASLPDWGRMVDTNISGLMNVTHRFLPGMVERKRGHIVNIGSTAGTYPYPGGNVYGATKAFVHQFSLNLRADLLGTGVRVTCVEPGLCGGTEFSRVRFRGDNDRAESVYQGLDPLKAEDIARTVTWIASQPEHVNVNLIEMMPVAQAFGPLSLARR